MFIYLFGVLGSFQHCTGHIRTHSWKGRGNQYIQLVKVLYCKLPTNGKQLSAFPLEVSPGAKPRSQRWEARVLPLCHHGPCTCLDKKKSESNHTPRFFTESTGQRGLSKMSTGKYAVNPSLSRPIQYFFIGHKYRGLRYKYTS